MLSYISSFYKGKPEEGKPEKSSDKLDIQGLIIQIKKLSTEEKQLIINSITEDLSCKMDDSEEICNPEDSVSSYKYTEDKYKRRTD